MLRAGAPTGNPADTLELALRDFDRLAISNDSTSILTNLDVVKRHHSRVASQNVQ